MKYSARKVHSFQIWDTQNQTFAWLTAFVAALLESLTTPKDFCDVEHHGFQAKSFVSEHLKIFHISIWEITEWTDMVSHDLQSQCSACLII